MNTRRELELQLVDAKRTGDSEWAKELQEALDDLEGDGESLESDADPLSIDRLQHPDRDLDADTMDDTPENDEEALEEIYELDPEVSAELERPVNTAHVLIVEASLVLRAKIEDILTRTVRNKWYKVDSDTYGLEADLDFTKFKRMLGAWPVGKQILKHGKDNMHELGTPEGNILVLTDSRGCIDAVSVIV